MAEGLLRVVFFAPRRCRPPEYGPVLLPVIMDHTCFKNNDAVGWFLTVRHAVLGSTAFVHIPAIHRPAKAIAGMLTGFSSRTSGCWDLIQQGSSGYSWRTVTVSSETMRGFWDARRVLTRLTREGGVTGPYFMFERSTLLTSITMASRGANVELRVPEIGDQAMADQSQRPCCEVLLLARGYIVLR